MIKYSLKCKSSHCLNQNSFDGWFQNIEAFDKQKSRALISCPLCGSDQVTKLLTAPSFRSVKVNAPINQTEKFNQEKQALSTPFIREDVKDLSAVLRTIKKEIEKQSEYVGKDFAKEARSIKEGEAKERSIYGHGTKKEIEELKDDGINILNIPWFPEDN